MASTYTSNLGVEKIGAGEQAGAWGTTTNNNFDIIDRAINGVGSISLSGTTHTLTTSDGTLSEGGNKVLVLGGSPSGTNTITISPNDQDKMFFVHNNSGQTATFTQGSGGNVSIPNGSKGLIFADGAGSSAKVTDLLDGFAFGGTKLTATALEINNSLDGGATVGTDAIADDDGIVTNDGGTMKQTKVQTFSTYFNANLVSVPSAITSSSATLTPSSAQSIYQKVDTSSNNVALTLAIGSLAIGQYIIVDKTSSSNTLTLSSSSSVSGADDSKHVNGTCAKTTSSTSAFTFPVGDGIRYLSLIHI